LNYLQSKGKQLEHGMQNAEGRMPNAERRTQKGWAWKAKKFMHWHTTCALSV